jgi:hypothetical protein
MYLHGKKSAMLGRSYNTKKDVNAMNDEVSKLLQQPLPEETDPVLGEPLFNKGRQAGIFKVVKDELSNGDMRIIIQENNNFRNCQNLFFFFALIVCVMFATGINCFLTFTMNKDIAGIALLTLAISIILDFLIFRNIFVICITIILKLLSLCKCSYRKISMGGKLLKEIRKMMKDVIKDVDGELDQVVNIKEALEEEASVMSSAPNGFNLMRARVADKNDDRSVD